MKRLWTMVSSAWKTVGNVYVKVGGSWKEVSQIHYKESGTWKQCYGKTEVFIGSNQTDFNLFTELGSPAYPIWAEVTVDTDVVVSATTTGNAAFDTGAMPAGSRIKLINNGVIHGMGGAGGHGGAKTNTGCDDSAQGTNGSAGGDAIETNQDLIIDNTNGYIFGGGGGGGGGRAEAGWCIIISQTLYCFADAAQGGGGGAGGGAGGCNGSNALIPVSSYCQCETEDGTGGLTGAGGTLSYWWAGDPPSCLAVDSEYDFAAHGGGYGQAGNNGITISPCTNTSTGGAAGKAIETNGNSVAWLGGENGTQVKGSYA